MATPNSCVSHIEAFVDTSRPANQQNASVDAIAALVKNDLLTLEALVREMELYLTTTDHVIRARGTLLLGEILSRLASKPLDNATITSLVGFFTSRLEDWQALHGTLVGCLALLRRKSNIGMIMGSEARVLAKTYLANVRAQSLAVHDRKLCFEVLQCLLDGYPDAVITLADELIYGILDSIDGEKDPRCLILTFHIAETLMKIFPDQSELGTGFAEELFEILGCYFPIYFTHQKSDDFEIKRDDLSMALMNAFCSTPYFEPFAIPLLLEKLSSSLPLAKLDSLKYLSSCISCYGADRMLKHARAIWSSLKDVIFDLSAQGIIFSSMTESARAMDSQENQIVKEAFTCLQMAITHLNCSSSEPFTSLILEDHDIERKLESTYLEKCYSGISEKSRCEICSLGSILSIASKVSTGCCSSVFEKLFPRLMNILGVRVSDSSSDCFTVCKAFPDNLNYGGLYLCVELLASCRDFTTVAETLPQVPDSWWSLLKDFSRPLTYAFRSALVNSGTGAKTEQEHISCVVKGMQVLATFPGGISPVSEETYEDILAELMSVVIGRSQDTFLWRTTLKALVQIGLHVEKFHDYKKQMSYNELVVKRIVSFLSHDDSTVSLALKLEAISEIGIAGSDYMSKVIHGLEEAIMSNFLEACVNGNQAAADILVPLLECYSSQMLPWCHKFGTADHVAMQFSVNIWNLMEESMVLNVDPLRQGVLDTTMMAMKIAVGYCTAEKQGTLVQKAYNILSSSTFLSLESLLLPLSNLEALQSIPGLSVRDEWLISLFASLVIALHPQTALPEVGTLIKVFIVFLLKGHLPAAQALASMLNKWPVDISGTEPLSTYNLEQAIDVIIQSLLAVLPFCSRKEAIPLNGANGKFSGSSTSSFQIQSVVGLAWIGKSLLIRGHERVKEIAMLLLKHLVSDQTNMIASAPMDNSENSSDSDMRSLVIRAAADAFHILLSDSENCLNKKFHATTRPLYKQRFFTSMVPVLLSCIKESKSSNTRAVLYRALGHIFLDTPLAVLVANANMVIPPLLEGLAVSSLEVRDKEMTYNLLLVLSGIIMDENGKEAAVENAHIIISNLIKLISYPHMMLVRETAIQCLTAMSALPHTRIYPLRPQVLRALAISLDDRKRVVRQEAVRCRQAWASIASRSLHF